MTGGEYNFRPGTIVMMEKQDSIKIRNQATNWNDIARSVLTASSKRISCLKLKHPNQLLGIAFPLCHR